MNARPILKRRFRPDTEITCGNDADIHKNVENTALNNFFFQQIAKIMLKRCLDCYMSE